MYHCGPTVYWTQHIGNMRAMVWADLVVRSLKYLGYQVKLTRNYTDVGHLTSDQDEGLDKMEKSAQAEKVSPQQIAEKYIQIFEKDIKALNIQQANYKPRATECIQDMIKTVQILLDKDFAYSTDLAIYFDISKAKDYTRLSRQNLDELFAGAGKAEVEDKNKRHANDFALWFFKAGKHKNALQTWSSPFHSPLVDNGQGFPGWHIECSVMANKFLGPTIDIHMGGVEHIPIHHTNEIAQGEAAYNKILARFWLHGEFLILKKSKMSKSKGNITTLTGLIEKGYNPLAYRYLCLTAHYRSPLSFSLENIKASQNTLDKIYNRIKELKSKSRKNKTYQEKFLKFVNDDLNMPKALALFWKMLDDKKLSKNEKYFLALDFDKVFGLGLTKIKKEKIPEIVLKLAQKREKYRQKKNWEKADEIRKKIEKSGYLLEDTEKGVKIKKKS